MDELFCLVSSKQLLIKYFDFNLRKNPSLHISYFATYFVLFIFYKWILFHFFQPVRPNIKWCYMSQKVFCNTFFLKVFFLRKKTSFIERHEICIEGPFTNLLWPERVLWKYTKTVMGSVSTCLFSWKLTQFQIRPDAAQKLKINLSLLVDQ